ncbi:hypothetical protein ACFV5N_10280 [Streptomyces sp. NPDC059853]|uniref:hypothetical protein n=1 Tax=Streptomyces sp. NPDC059853 TaxID=3346973 RepID=UPI00364F1CF2
MGSKIGKDVPPGRRKLAGVLRVLYGHLGAASLTDAGELFSEWGHAKDPGQISRYLNGKTLPPEGFVRLLFDLAVQRSGVAQVGLGWADVQEAYAAAERTLCRRCVRLQEEIRILKAAAEQGGSSEPDADAEERTEVSGSGVASSDATPLPVPRTGWDRQPGSRDASAAHVVASGLVARAGALGGQGNLSVLLELFQGAAGLLTPEECAAAIAAFHRQPTADSSQFAETLLRIYGRERPAEDVMAASLELLEEHRLPADAGALLKAGLGERPGEGQGS